MSLALVRFWFATAIVIASVLQCAVAQPKSGDAPVESVTVTAPKAADVKPTPFLSGG